MDFGTLLSVAQKNGTSKQSTSYYPSKFTPPKKESKQTKNLSDNIRKFLARKEEEERQKAVDAKRKKENLLALRDHKAQTRINKHLKVCKSANKSVLADAVDNDNTAVTMAGPSQPDEDDYGYVSQEASAYYNQLMTKYNNLPPEKPLFSQSGKRTVKDIASTKDRVKQALKQKELEDAPGHRRKRKSHASTADKESFEEPEVKFEKEKVSSEREKEKEKEERPKPKKKPAPPPMDFMQLLRLAEKKQHEPIVLDVKPKPAKVEEPERLMTKRQMKEYRKEKEWRERKEQRERNPESAKPSSSSVEVNKPSKPMINRIPKLNSSKSVTNTVPEKSLTPKPATSSGKKPYEKPSAGDKSSSSKHSEKDQILEERKKLEAEKKQLEEMRRSIEEEKRKLAQSKSKRSEDGKPFPVSSNKLGEKSRAPDRVSSSKDIKSRQLPSSEQKPRQFPPPDVRPKQFPPADVRPARPKQFPPKDVKRKPGVNKRRICDDDDDDHDSELDDFIDDGPEEGAEDYSKYISEIFGYDKSKYRDEDFNDAAMESNFAQQLKEEYVSTKIGILEDLEDIRMEAEEKKRKAISKKKLKKY